MVTCRSKRKDKTDSLVVIEVVNPVIVQSNRSAVFLVVIYTTFLESENK